jgi:hypothetical protein
MDRRETQQPSVPPELSADTRRIADRLQELSVEEAERVLERAINLQTWAPGADPADTLDTDTLGRIAAELDIDPRHLEQALLEELLRVETEQPGVLDRLFVPASMTTHGAVAGSRQAVREVVDAWMINHEGLRKRAETGAVTKWEKDRGFAAFVRKALKMSRGDRALRTAVGVSSAVRPATETQQVVVLEADTSNLRMLAVGLVAGAAAVGAAVAGTSGALDPGGLGLDNLAAGAGTFAMLGGGVLIGMKMWASRVRNGLNRAIEAISSPHLVEKDTSVPSAVRRWVGQMRTLRDDVRDDSRS